MKPRLILATLLLLGLTTAPAQESESPGTPETEDVHGLRPAVGTTELIRKAQSAHAAGVRYLIQHQNADGSFGNHDPEIASLMDFGFRLRNRGSQDGVRIACTALCAQVLLQMEDRSEVVQRALDRAIEELLKADKIAYEFGESFNTWGYGYKLDFLTRLLETGQDPPLSKRIKKAAKVCIDGLLKYRQHEGGWGYYARPMNDFESMSFNTAVFAMALERAKRHGLEVPEGIIADAAAIVQEQRVRDGSFVYSSNQIGHGGAALMNLGAGSRTATCALMLHTLGRYRAEDLEGALRVFQNGEPYLEKGRKLIQPHSAPHAVSGYFYFFGYYYAAEVMDRLGDRVSKERWNRHAWQMLRTQEPDGRWWDTASGHYGDKWGTAFALLTLDAYLKAARRFAQREI